MLVKIISERLSLPLKGVQGTVTLLEQGSTIPFISRYRKEVTGSLDEVQISDIKTLWDRLQEIESRKATILSTIESQGALTDELRSLIERCYDMTQLEDIYLPYKPKRRTRAMIARERGLEPLSELILGQRTSGIEQRAKEFISDQVATLEEAISGACDIIAEKICEKPSVRSLVRREFSRVGLLRSVVVKGKEVEG
ncbi:MAG: Tex-like N-terminal domain-containing protein, partial [Rikenellaceae bacterium]